MVPPKRFRLVAGADELETYQFGTFTARHLFVDIAASPLFYRPRADPTKYMINVRCLDGVDLGTLRIEKFDGRNWETTPDAPYTGIWKD